MQTNRGYCAGTLVLAMVVALTLLTAMASAQVTTANVRGTVLDASGAIVPKADVALKNEGSGDTRRTVSNSDGYFNFSAVPPGNYTLTIEKSGFSTWEARSVVLNSGDERGVTGIQLKPGAAKEVVTVEATGSSITPIDSGEKSSLITQKVLQNVAIIGQNAAEFVKIMPGMAYTGGALNQSSYAAQDERTGNGPVGNFSANGLRTAALDITSDGAHIIDPGCNCGQAMNTNADMTQEVKVMTSNFGADASKGPVVISAIGKSGGQQFHGEAYTYARYYSLNANDWLNNHAGTNYATGQQIAPRPQSKYFYPGFQISGPVIIPGTNFNHSHDKLFFFFGTEYYKQDVDNGIYRAVVPTADMRNGIFNDLSSAPANANGCPYYTENSDHKSYTVHTDNCYIHNLNGGAVVGIPGGNNYQTIPLTTSTGVVVNVPTGVIKAGGADPNGQRLMGVYPLANANPAVNQGNNYISSGTRFSNMLQFRGRVDYSISDSTKLYVSYNHQKDSAEESLDTLWTGNGQSWASPTTPYPSPLIEKTTSDVISANLVKVFSPTLTNEVIFTYTYLNLPNSFQNPAKVSRAGLGLNYQLYYNHPNPGNLIFPQITGWGDGISNMLNSGFELNGVVYAKKTLPSIADNVSKVWGTHTTKFGFYWERTWNSQPGNGAVNGTAIFSNWGSNTSGNAYADMLIGQTTQYSEQNFNVVPAFRYMSAEFYGQDSWKVSRRLTLEYGMRLSHLGPWVDTTGYGFAAWYPSLYPSDAGATANGVKFPGLQWHSANSQTALSGSGSRAFFYNPRVGFAWDMFGTGKTVLRGGYGMYRYHDEQNVQNPAYGVVRGSFTSPTAWSPTLASLAPTTSVATPSSLVALDPKDTFEPRTQSYSLTVAERLPWKSVLEVAYVGSKSDYLSNYNNNFDQVNDPPVLGLFNAATCAAPGSDGTSANGTGTTQCGWLPNCNPTLTDGSGSSCDHPDSNHGNGFSGNQVTQARPLYSGACIAAGNCLGTLKIIDHKMYSNYNSMQLSWNKQAGHMTFLANYTYSKALGIRGENGAAAGDPTNLHNNYGTLPNNRKNIFNLAYVYEFPTLKSGSRFLKGAANGWQVSGIAQYQSGSDIQASITSNFNYIGFIQAGAQYGGKTLAVPIQAGGQNTLGSADITLMPKVICNPRSGLKTNQFINGACFSPYATPGQQGTYIFPTLTGPGFFNTDLSVFKNFTMGASETKKLQFRFSGYNFLNHPVQTFVANDPGLNLTFNSTGQLQQNGGTTFGFANNKTGHRIVQAVVKFSW